MEEGVGASMDLYLILSGDLKVMKKARHNDDHIFSGEIDEQFTIAQLTAGDAIGELGFIKGDPRSASIRSLTTSVLLGLNPNDLLTLEAEFPKTSNQMMKNMLGYVADRLSKTSANEVKVLRAELQNSILTSKANLFFSYVIGLLCIYNLTIHTITNLSMDANKASVISAMIIVVFGGVLFLMIRQSKLPLPIYGLTTKKWKLAVKESLLWTIVLMAALIIIKWTLIHQVPRYQHLSLFDFDLNGKKYLAFNFLLYGLHSPIQEFVARGVLQGSLQHFFIGKNITLRAIVVSNALFSATHVHLLNGLLGVIVFIPGLFWGWLYSRHQNLIGVSLSHIMIGWSTLFFLNIESLF
jgi:membrane protease YdiL (CAAX protease family)